MVDLLTAGMRVTRQFLKPWVRTTSYSSHVNEMIGLSRYMQRGLASSHTVAVELGCDNMRWVVSTEDSI